MDNSIQILPKKFLRPVQSGDKFLNAFNLKALLRQNLVTVSTIYSEIILHDMIRNAQESWRSRGIRIFYWNPRRWIQDVTVRNYLRHFFIISLHHFFIIALHHSIKGTILKSPNFSVMDWISKEWRGIDLKSYFIDKRTIYIGTMPWSSCRVHWLY